MVERTQEVQEELAAKNDKKGKIAEKEKETAEDVRKRSMGRLGETKARENAKKAKKAKSSSLDYFKEKHERELELKREEMELKKREMAMKEKEAERAWEIKVKEQEAKKRDEEIRGRNESSMIATLQQQLQQQQSMFVQIQQQNKLLLELLNIKTKN